MELHYQKDEAQQPQSKSMRFYFGLLGVVFIISNALSLIFLIKVLFTFIGIELERLFYWIGIALLSIFIYPIFRRAMPRDKHIMLLVSALGLIVATLLMIFLPTT